MIPQLTQEQWLILAGGTAGLLLVGFLLLLPWLRRRRAARRAEAAISAIAYDVLRNVLLPNGMGGQIHLHYLLLTEQGLLVIDPVNAPGAIFGGDQMIEWTSIGRKRRYTFPNPQHALFDRMAAVRLLAGDVPVDGRIVFSLNSEFPKGRPHHVVRIDGLKDEFAVIDTGPGSAAAAFAAVWQTIHRHAEPNPLA